MYIDNIISSIILRDFFFNSTNFSHGIQLWHIYKRVHHKKWLNEEKRQREILRIVESWNYREYLFFNNINIFKL